MKPSQIDLLIHQGNSVITGHRTYNDQFEGGKIIHAFSQLLLRLQKFFWYDLVSFVTLVINCSKYTFQNPTRITHLEKKHYINNDNLKKRIYEINLYPYIK